MNLDDGEYLLRLSRAALTLWLEEGLTTTPPDPLPDELRVRRPMWVSLYTHPHHIHCASMGVLHDPPAITEAAINAAILLARPEHNRVSPLSSADLRESTLELSIASELRPLEAEDRVLLAEHIVPGRHGVVMEDDERRVILPPHAVVTPPPTMPRFLDEVCERCGLAPEFWRQPDTAVATFTTETFAERWPMGEIERQTIALAAGVGP
jgi:AMMECR1 domain-containing protein